MNKSLKNVSKANTSPECTHVRWSRKASMHRIAFVIHFARFKFTEHEQAPVPRP